MQQPCPQNGMTPTASSTLQNSQSPSSERGFMKSVSLPISCRHSSNYDNEEIFFQQAKAYLAHPLRNDSISSLDSSPSRRSSPTSWVSSHTQPTIPSPTSATFSIRSKPSNPSLQRVSIFKRLPQEVYDSILAQLQELHSDRLSPSCATCYMRDLVALQLTSRSWDKGVRKTL